MSSPHDKYGPDKRVYWRLLNVAQTFGAQFGRSDSECKAVAAYGYQWLREQPIPAEVWAVALSQANFDDRLEVVFREWFRQAAAIVRDLLKERGSLDLPAQYLVPPWEALTDEPVGDPNLLRAFEKVKHRVGAEHYQVFLRVFTRDRKRVSIDEIARHYRMAPDELQKLYDQILRVLEDPYEF
jgi:hypothetical protein